MKLSRVLPAHQPAAVTYILDFLPDNPHQYEKDEQQHEKSPSVVTSMFLLSLNKLIQSHVKRILLIIIIIT